MKNALAKCREACSFIAGLLIGVSIVVLVIVMTASDHDGWKALEIFGALVLALGLALQVIVTAKPQRPPSAGAGSLAARFMELVHER